MLRNSLILIISLCLVIVSISTDNDKNQKTYQYEQTFQTALPVPNRGLDSKLFISASVLVSADNSTGSGTIIYFDHEKNEAYVASCGHLWDYSLSASQLEGYKKTCEINIWYKNNQRIVKTYEAEVLFTYNSYGKDVSLLKFKCDWRPQYFPIAPLDYELIEGKTYNSTGCDKGTEVANYLIEYLESTSQGDIYVNNSPMSGRSGGGLLDDQGWYVGTCVRTTHPDSGDGRGYFTNLATIHRAYKENGYGWLLRKRNPRVNSFKDRPLNYFPYPDSPVQFN